MATLLLISGGLDLSLGSAITLSGVVLALMLQAGYNAAISSIVAILSGTLIGVLNGGLVAMLGIPAFIVTLGTMNLVDGLALALTNKMAIFFDNPTMVYIGAGDILGIPIPIVIAIVIFMISYILFHHTSFGRYLIAIGENKEGTHLSGVNTKRVTWLIFIYASTMAAISGVVLASRIQTADPLVGVGWGFEAVAAAIMGGTVRGDGKGDITYTIIGVLFILVLRNGLTVIGLPTELRIAVVGLCTLGGIIFDRLIRRREI
jgi:ribose transport system permease protein